MNTRPILTYLCVAIALSACGSTKPQDANNNSIDNELFTQVDTSKSPNDAQIHLYVSSAESQLLMLAQQSTKHCITGQLSIADSLLIKASREHKANMNKDAFITLVELDRQIIKIRCINQYINNNLGCGYTDKKTLLKRWYSEGDFNQCQKTPLAKSNEENTIEDNAVNTNNVITEMLFDFNQYQIKPIYFSSLDSLIELMSNYPDSTLFISGHTDSKGSASYNMHLSKKRASNVAKYFTDRGIAPSNIAIESKGEEKMREHEQSDVSRMFNRYTSITLILDKRDNKAI
jgi:outer membrane protein OmpA-like peptidoglycan-associated protein